MPSGAVGLADAPAWGKRCARRRLEPREWNRMQVRIPRYGRLLESTVHIRAACSATIVAVGMLAGTNVSFAGTNSPVIAIDYPSDRSIFPPEITPPTFLWRDPARTAQVWRFDITFADGSPPIHATSHGERMRIGRIDPECISKSNELPRLT